ncbi:MAG: tRNA uridine-5-carboxymethylaminomethyl(34) synthesis GTPase MnmE [Proteobacteria bacterium]|nr:tRNA uridine-5-carboxymethylaminomethyl(34) synthesis GTPase MnmE [Pseudomonadota bacterium]
MQFTAVQNQTIYALATPYGKSGVAVLRISGPMAVKILADLGYERVPTPRSTVYCKFIDRAANEIIDHGLFIYFQGPHSFTGEDVVELHVHGGIAVIKHFMKVLGNLPYLRPAEAGEFSKRAFLNDKFDLTMAEGLVDLINAETEVQKKVALRQYGGVLERLYDSWRNQILQGLARIEAYIDFPEEDIPEEEVIAAVKAAHSIAEDVAKHLHSNPTAELIAEGLHIAIFGPPNAGKSSLLNWLASKEVAIVSDIPGTTRDVLQVRLELNGMLAIFYDTAGLRESTEDSIEQKGITKALAVLAGADLKILVLDSANQQQAQEFLVTHQSIIDDNTICLLNKSDIVLSSQNLLAVPNARNVVAASLTTNQGLEQFMSLLQSAIGDNHYQADVPLITKARYRKALQDCYSALLIDATQPLDLIAEGMRDAAWHIGSITGKIGVEEVLDVVFSTFCIGK